MEKDELIKKNALNQQIARSFSPEAQNRLAYVAEMDSVSGMHMKLVGMQKAGASQDQIDSFKQIVDAATKRFLEKTVVA